MSDKVLSQDEVDAILGGMEAGEAGAESAEEASRWVRPYDFKAREGLSSGRMPGLELANDRFARLFRDSLSSMTMRPADVRGGRVEMTAFGEFIKTLPIPSAINIFTMEPLEGRALFVMEHPTVYGFIEYLFGGGGRPWVKPRGRHFTPMEQRIVKRIASLALKDMASSWEALAPLEPRYEGLEMNPRFVGVIAPAEDVVKMDVEVEIEDFSATAYFLVPYRMVEPIRHVLYSGILSPGQGACRGWAEALREAIGESRVQVRVELGEAELTLGGLMGLEAGDVIPLGKAAPEGASVRVEGVCKFTGMLGRSRGNQAVRITGPLQEP